VTIVIIPKLDLLLAVKKHMALPLTSWSLKPVAAWCGFVYTGEMDGCEASLRYETFLKHGELLPAEQIARYHAEA
jgi:predicted RecB family nuclease